MDDYSYNFFDTSGDLSQEMANQDEIWFGSGNNQEMLGGSNTYNPSDFGYGNIPSLGEMFQQSDYGYSPDPTFGDSYSANNQNFPNVMSMLQSGGQQAQQTPLGGTENTLAQLFNSKGGVAGIDSIGKLLAAAYTENQRKKAGSSAVSKLLASQKDLYDPSAQMRNTAMQQFDQATANPMSVPMIKQQVDAATQAQRIKDAAAGRRSNDILGNVQIMGKAGEIGNNYLNTMSRMYSQPTGSSLASSLYPQALQNDANQGGALAMAISNMTSLDPEIKQAILAKLKKDAGI